MMGDVEDVYVCANFLNFVGAYAAEDLLNDEDDTQWEKVTVFMEDYYLMSDPAFRMHFRVNRRQCEILCIELLEHLQEQGKVVELPPPRGKSFPHQLLIALWLLATPDSFRSVALRFGVHKSQAHNYYVKVIVAIRELGRRYITWPDRAERVHIKNFLHGYSGFPGVVGRKDGKHFFVSKPVHQPAAFRNRHHGYSLNVQAVSDHRGRFRDVYIGEAGSLHDARVFRRSPLFRSILFDDNFMEPDEHIIGDSAYMLLDRVMTPFQNNGHLTPQQLNYNYCHARCRTGIEMAFGGLTQLWRRDKYLHSFNMDYAVDHIAATFVLRNFRIMLGDEHQMAPVNNAEVWEVIDREAGEGVDGPDALGAHDNLPDPYEPQDGAQRLQEARNRGIQKRWDICNGIPFAVRHRHNDNL